MKGKLFLAFGFVGILAVSFGFSKGFQKTEASIEVSSKQTERYKLVTREEQDRSEGMVTEGKDVITVITAEEQKMVENNSAQQGFVSQKNGTGFYFIKGK